MTRDIDYMMSVMQAFKEGKKIEVYDWMKQIWLDAEHPYWDWAAEDYRVKAEPKYRPYANADECFKDVVKHGGWIRDKEDERSMLHIIRIGTYVGLNGCSHISYDMLYNGYSWADDGSPCGVLEE